MNLTNIYTIVNTRHNMKITILSASVNPEYYDIAHIAEMSYDEAKEYFKNDRKKT